MMDSREKIKVQRTTGGQLAALLILMLFSVPAFADTPMPNIPKAVKGDQCVEETDFMRKNHMDLLLHQRDETMHEGIRTKKHSLKECLTCHAVKGEDQQPVTAADPRHFCSQCHTYAAVQVDCFQCHASTPSADVSMTGLKVIGMKSSDMKTPDLQSSGK